MIQPVVQISLAMQRMRAYPLCPRVGLYHGCRDPPRLRPYLAFTSSGVESPSACCPAIESAAMGLLLGPLAAKKQDHNLRKVLEMLASSSGARRKQDGAFPAGLNLLLSSRSWQGTARLGSLPAPLFLCVGLCGDRTPGQIDLAMTRCSYSYTRSGMAP